MTPCDGDCVALDVFNAIKYGDLEHFKAHCKISSACLRSMRFGNALTPLHLAVMHNKDEIVRYLIDEVRVDVEAMDAAEQTATDWAMLCRNFAMLDALNHCPMKQGREHRLRRGLMGGCSVGSGEGRAGDEDMAHLCTPSGMHHFLSV